MGRLRRRLRIREALGRSAQAGRHANPDLESSFENDPRFREWRAEIGFSQRFPVTDRLRREKEIGRTEIRTAEAEVREVERGLITSARQAVIGCTMQGHMPRKAYSVKAWMWHRMSLAVCDGMYRH